MGFVKTIRDFLGRTVNNSIITGSNESLLSTIYIKEMALYIATSYICNTLSKCEFKVYNKNEEVHDQLYYLLNVSPNKNENSSQFINKMIKNFLYKGECVVFPYKNNLYCADGYLIDPHPFKENIFQNFQVDIETLNKKIKASDLFYFKLDNTPAKKFIDDMYQDYGVLVAQAINSYKQTNSTKYKYEIDSYAVGDQDFEKDMQEMIEKDLKNFIQSDLGVLPIYKGSDLKLLESSTKTNTSDVISLRKEIFEITSQAFKIPLSMMYGNITNMNEIVKVYLTVCIDPIADMLSEEITRKTSTFSEWKNGNYVKVDTSCISYMDILEVSSAVDKLIASGVCNIDEMRERLNFTTLNTEFSQQYFMTKNYSKIDDVIKDVAEPTPIIQEDEQEDEEKENKNKT